MGRRPRRLERMPDAVAGLGARAVRRGYDYADSWSGHEHAGSVAHQSSAPDGSAEPPSPGWRRRRPIDVAELPESAAQLGQHGLIDRVVLGVGDGIAFGDEQRPELQEDQTLDRRVLLERAAKRLRGQFERGPWCRR